MRLEREISLTRLQILASPREALYIVPSVGLLKIVKEQAAGLERPDLIPAVANYLGRCHIAISNRKQCVVVDHSVWWPDSLAAMTRTDRQAFRQAFARLTQLGLIHTP